MSSFLSLFDKPHSVDVLFLVVFALLGIASIAAALLWRLFRGRAYLDFMKRLLSWWIVTITLLVVVYSPYRLGLALFGILLLRGLYEVWRAMRHESPWLFLRLLPLFLLALLALDTWRESFLPVAGLALFVITACRLLWRKKNPSSPSTASGAPEPFSLANALLVVALTLWTLLHLFYWLAENSERSLFLFCWLFLLIQLNDIAQYFAGKAWGRTRIAPVLSPRKTLEGLVGGLVFTVLVTVVFRPASLNFNLPFALCLGVVIALGGYLGDILFSALKRKLGIKDFADLLPGQGGVMDRLDSATVVTPVCFYLLLLLPA